MTPGRLLAIALLGTAAWTAARAAPAPAPAPPSFDRTAWQSDFARIKQGLAQGYANLDWQVDRRGINLARASGHIDALLAKASSDVEAALILSRLVAAFDDPHLELEFGPPPARARLFPLVSSVDGPAASPDCAVLNYGNDRPPPRLPYPQAPGWRTLAEAPFFAGTIGDIGVLRIPAFGEDRYLDICKAAAKAGMDERQLQHATRAELNRRLRSLLVDLRGRGARRLVVDVTGNGGGTEWSSEVAAMFATGPLRRVAQRRAGPSCDRSALWTGAPRPCSIYAGPEQSEDMQGTGEWTGPVVVLADRRSASATEEFITWLKDNGKAVIVGERTFGAGCGYVDGGSAIALKAAPLHLMMPNCSRYTRDGINEIEGIAPHVAVDWPTVGAGDFPALLARAFAERPR